MHDSFDDFRVRAADDPASLLIVILDTSIESWIEATGETSPDALQQAVAALRAVTEQVLVFIRTFLLLHESNRVAVIVSGTNMTELVFPAFPPVAQLPPGYSSHGEDSFLDDTASMGTKDSHVTNPEEAFLDLRERVVDGVQRSIQSQERPCNLDDALPVTTALATALCLLNRARRIKSSRIAGTEEKGQNRADTNDYEAPSNGRILHLLAGKDDPKQYVPVMNCIFSAQRIGVLIDTCVLASQDSTYFQQAAHLTHGAYLKPENFSTKQPDSLIQLLHAVFLVDKQSRDFLAMPTPDSVDFRASCLQTKKIIDSGYTCSVCLSTFDVSVGKKAAICPICNARYAISRPPKRQLRS